MEMYKCIEGFELPFFDEDGRMTDGVHMVSKDSVWEYSHDYASSSDARLYLKDGNSDFEYVDITYERLGAYFMRIE